MEMSMTNLLWFFAVILLAGNNGFGGLFGGNNRVPMGPPPASQQDLTAAINNQSLQNELNAISLATANNNYETARLISDQNMVMQNQNNSNLINIVQGFNAVVQQMQNQTAQLSQQIAQIGFQMDSCCCKIQTQILQQQLDEARAKTVSQEGIINNYNQSQYILSQLGKFVANAPAAAA